LTKINHLQPLGQNVVLNDSSFAADFVSFVTTSTRIGSLGNRHWNMTFTIRRAKPSDWESYRAIRLRSLLEEPQAYKSEYETEAHFEPDRWQQRLATAASYLVFDDDHALVGTATGLWTADRDMLVVGMYVAPEARDHNCAHLLLDAIVDLAVRDQGRRLVLEVAESNIHASRSYRSYGFIETGRRRRMDRDPSIIEIELAYPLPADGATRDRR
jgi:ribosomal protein S18 acetylase RimI-like enzyme